MRPVHVRGVGLWTLGHANPKAWCARDFDEAATTPDASLLSGALRRRATPLTRMGIEVLQQAARMADVELSELASVWATAHGEHSMAIGLLEMMQQGEGKLSPTKFHNSVHNTASGYASIASHNRSPSTTLTGGAELVASALIEAACMLDALDRDVAVVIADEPLLTPFEVPDSAVPLAVALLLSPRAEGALGVLTDIRRAAVAPVPRRAPFGGLHASAALPLIEHIVEQKTGTIALELEGGPAGAVWCLDHRFPA